jgi:hypothetical protein
MKQRWTILTAISCGMLVAACASMNGDDKDDANEQTVTLEQVPAAAKATLMKEAGAGRIDEIDKLMRNGKTVYEADVMLDGKKWEIAVSEDGKLLSKELDEEKDDEDDRDDDRK